MNFLKNEQKRKPFMYVPLVMDTDFSTGAKLKKNKGYKKSRSKKLKTYIPTAKKMLSPKDLLMNDEKSILLVGKPGVGKTTVALEILRLWTEEKNIPVSYMFYFDEPLMRVFSQSPYPQNLKDLLFQKYISPDKAPDQVLENIKSNSENVFIIFDGIMDVTGNSVIKQLMEKELLKDAKVLTTCRPEAEDTGYLSDWRSYRVEVQGFNHKSIFEYFKWMLGTTDDIGALENPELFSLCSVPLYAFIVAACISVSPTEARNKPFTVTEMYVRIFRFCMKQHGHQDVEHLDKYIKDNKRDVINLALASYQAMLAKTVNLTDLDHEDKSVQNAFLTKQFWNPSTTSCKVYAFLHNTMQEFWAALYLILNPDKITNVLDKCQNNEDGKYLKYIMPFLSGLLSDNVVELIECLVPVEQIEATRVKYIQQIIDTFLYTKEQNQEGDCEQFVEADNILFVCRCLYEYQFPEACRLFLEKVQYELDLEDQRLDPYQCCVISYVANQAVHRKIDLDLTDCSITDPGLKLLLSSLKNLKFLRSTSTLKSQMWRVALAAGQFSDFDSLLSLFSFEMHLSALETLDQKVFQRIGEVLKNKRSENSVHLFLHVNEEVITRSLQRAIFESLPNIATIRIFPHQFKVAIETELYLQGAIYETGQRCVRKLLSVCSNNQRESFDEQCKFLLKLHEHAKNMDVLPVLQPVFYALPPTWVVQPSNPSVSLLLQTMEVLNLKKPAELDHVTYELSELKIILQCMPYITEMRFSAVLRQPKDIHKIVKIVADLFILASESGGGKLRSLSAACSYSTFPFVEDSKYMQSYFLMDLFTQLKESSSWKITLPALKPILQVAPAVWTLDLQKLEKTFALTELLKLQAIRKSVELTSWSCEREKLRSFLNCLPYISHLCCNEQFFQSVCEVLSADSEWNPNQIAELLRSLGFSISLIDMLPSRLCKAVGNVFKLLDKEEDISLRLLPQMISCQGCAYLFSNVKKLQILRVNEVAIAKLARLVISDQEINAVTVEELSLVLANSHLPERALCQLLSNLTSLLRVWRVHNLNLSEFKIEPHWLICLLCHQGPLSIKISPRFVRAALKEIYQNHAGHLIVKLVKSSANLINLCMRELDSTDCKALCFALHYSDGVKLNLLNSVIPNNETDSIVKLLHRVSDLRHGKTRISSVFPFDCIEPQTGLLLQFFPRQWPLWSRE
uniref:NACHT domain-containing protein n=1 Tax=Cyprinus carpio carpio TaxID=630221 RepID=A0A8C1HLQ5_CYPCA